MKKIIIVFAFLFSFSLSKGQQSFLFKIRYNPNNLYTMNMVNGMNMKMNFSGDSASMARIKAKGIKVPMIITSETNMDADIKTGNIKSGNSYPIVLLFKGQTTQKTINGVESNEPPNPMTGQAIFGQYTADGKMQIDSISGKVLDEQTKQAIGSGISNMINQMQFPTTPMKVGDTFNQQVPFNLPMASADLKATIDIVYKLTSVDGNLAHFDLDESMDLNMSTEKNGTTLNVKGDGKGNGKLVYDIKDNYAASRNADLKMHYEMLVGKLTIDAEAEITSTTQTKMSALKK